jgi:hypothetical protein
LISPRAERKVHWLVGLASDCGFAGGILASAVVGNSPDAIGVNAKANDTPAATALRKPTVKPREWLRIKRTNFDKSWCIDRPPRK